MATTISQPPRFSRSGSEAAHTASSKSRASAPSMVTKGRSRRSLRWPRVTGRAASAAANTSSGNRSGMSFSRSDSKEIARGSLRLAKRSMTRAFLRPKRVPGSTSAITNSLSLAPFKSFLSISYSARARRSVGCRRAPWSARRRTPITCWGERSSRRMTWPS